MGEDTLSAVAVDDPVGIDLVAANADLEAMGADERIRWAVETFGQDAVLLSSMQKTASVLMHSFHRLGLGNEILFVDTGYHFPETLRLRDEFARRYGLNVLTLYPDLTAEQQELKYERKLYMFVDGQPECCRMRKTQPFVDHVKASGRKICTVGLRREEGGRREGLQPLSADPRTGALSLHPILDWTDADVRDYLATYDVPVHPLHAQRYPSIGCECCTSQVADGEDPRAGRWRHLREPGEEGPQYCNILFSDGAGI